MEFYKEGGIVLPYKDMYPKIDPSVYIAPTALIIGNVEINKESSIWFHTIIRGDVHYIKIGQRSNIQDLSVVHVTNGKWPTIIGDEVSIAHGVKLHGCTIHNRCLIGIGAIILDGAEIGDDCLVAAGSLVPEGFKCPPGSLIMGVPAKVKRELTEKDRERIKWHFQNYVGYREEYLNGVISDKKNKN